MHRTLTVRDLAFLACGLMLGAGVVLGLGLLSLPATRQFLRPAWQWRNAPRVNELTT